MLAWGGSAAFGAPEQSLRPEQRPGGEVVAALDGAVQQEVSAAGAPQRSLRPILRPGEAATLPEEPSFGSLFTPLTPRMQRVLGGTDLAARLSLRPWMRPEALVARVRAAESSAARAETTRQTPSRVAQPAESRGRLCGIRGLYGEELETITGRIGGCGIAEPIRLREVDGVTLAQPATINCDTAAALQTWLREAAQPAVGRRGGGIASLRVVASYACRTRNSQPGARLSEHALGNAIDIAAVNLRDGSSITVLQGWRDRRDGPILRAMHEGACGTFGTVLGPESDRFHQDHFHFDTAAYRSGAYCR